MAGDPPIRPPVANSHFFFPRPGVQGIGFLVHPSDKESIIESKSRRRIDPSRKKFGIGLPFQFTRFSFQGVKPTVGRSDENQITFADCRRGVNFSARFKFPFLGPRFPVDRIDLFIVGTTVESPSLPRAGEESTLSPVKNSHFLAPFSRRSHRSFVLGSDIKRSIPTQSGRRSNGPPRFEGPNRFSELNGEDPRLKSRKIERKKRGEDIKSGLSLVLKLDNPNIAEAYRIPVVLHLQRPLVPMLCIRKWNAEPRQPVPPLSSWLS